MSSTRRPKFFARSRPTRVRLAQGGLSLLPLGALMASAWMSAPAGPQDIYAAHAAPARLWAGRELDGPGSAVGLELNVPDGAAGPRSAFRVEAQLPSPIELSGLNGTNGFRINGILVSEFSGFAVSAAGDVNGDGKHDMLIGAPFSDVRGVHSGQSYVVNGGTGLPSTFELSALNGTNGFRINGISAADYSGKSVSSAGDVNRDGFDDILIGARGADPHGSRSGQSYVVYGRSVMPATVDLSALNGTNGFRVNGIAAGDTSGNRVSGAGDVNHDGFADILIGAPYANSHGVYSGQSYVVYGKSAMPSTVELSGLNGSNGFFVNGVSTGDYSGVFVSGAGDMNGDGIDDIVIGATGANPHGIYSGQSYVVYGRTAMPATVEPSALNGTNGFRINGISLDDYSGRVSGAGDVNNDGFTDIVIGAPFSDPHGGHSGQSYVVYGKSTMPATLDLSALNGTNGLFLNGISMNDYSGKAVSGAGDVNADGFADIVIGSVYADPHGTYSGQSYLVYGNSTLPATIDLSALNGTNGALINGISTNDYSGKAVSGIGDVNSDGFGDLLIGAPDADPNGNLSGQSYVVYGNGPVAPTPARGDCNGDFARTAADVSSIVLEIFDGDGTDPAAVGGGTFHGNPTGCNANADTKVDAGDLACLIRLIFRIGGGCGP